MGGNVKIENISATPINTVYRKHFVKFLINTLDKINQSYQQTYNTPLWCHDLFESKNFLSGSSYHLVDPLNQISCEEFHRYKSLVGDIDLQVDQNQSYDLEQWLSSLTKNQQFGDSEFIGFKKSGTQFITLWNFTKLSQIVKTPQYIQIDFELKKFQNGYPSEWSRFSASSDWNDIKHGIKGVFHKYLIQSLTVTTEQEFVLRKTKGRGNNKFTVDEIVNDSFLSFAVGSREGGGLRNKYQPVLNSENQQELLNNLPVYKSTPTTGYRQDINEIFSILFNSAPATEVSNFWSFIGIVYLIKKYTTRDQQQLIINKFINKLFDQGAQQLYRDPEKDRQEKTIVLRYVIDEFSINSDEQIKLKIDEYYYEH